jgi:hypothetical protein
MTFSGVVVALQAILITYGGLFPSPIGTPPSRLESTLPATDFSANDQNHSPRDKPDKRPALRHWRFWLRTFRKPWLH